MRYSIYIREILISAFIGFLYMMPSQIVMMGVLLDNNIVLIIVGLALSAYVLFRIGRYAWPKYAEGVKLKNTLLSVLLVLVVGVGSQLLLQLIFTVPEDQQNQEMINLMFENSPMLIAIAVVVIAPIVEEYVFRELMPYRLTKVSKEGFESSQKYQVFTPASIIIPSIAFIALHAPSGLYGYLLYGLVAGVFVYVRMKTNNLIVSMISHMLWNAFGVVLMILGMG